MRDEDFERLLDLAYDENKAAWEMVGQPDNVEVNKRIDPSCPFVMMRTRAQIPNIPPTIVFEVLVNQEVRRSWDKVICNLEIIDDFPEEGRSILYYMVKTPIGVSNRDFL